MKYPDGVLTSGLIRERLAMEGTFDCRKGDGTKGHYWAISQLPSTREIVGSQNFVPSVFDIDPHPMQKNLAEELLRSLNREVGHDGGWIVGFSHPPASHNLIRSDGDNVFARMFCIWLDEDGDPQFTYETDEDMAMVIQTGSHYFTQMCEESYQKWLDLLGKQSRKELGIKDSDLTKLAQSTM